MTAWHSVQVFQVWYQVLADGDHRMKPAADMRGAHSVFPGLIDLSRKEQKRRLVRVVTKYQNDRKLLRDPKTENPAACGERAREARQPHMNSEAEPKRYVVNVRDLPAGFPTHGHAPEFWEALGRAVATFGFLEETLGKAIFSFTATRRIPPDASEAEFEKWLPTLERALIDPLGGLIDSYAKVVRDHGGAAITNFKELLEDLRKASALRNVLCHGSWRLPDAQGQSLPLFVNKRKEVFQSPIDIAYLNQVQRDVAELVGAVVSTVTHMGWQFPGSNGPGLPIWTRQGGKG
jgi:hypothetical protein